MVASGFKDCIAPLVARGADVNMRDAKHGGITALMMAGEAAIKKVNSGGDPHDPNQFISQLLNLGADKNLVVDANHEKSGESALGCYYNAIRNANDFARAMCLPAHHIIKKDAQLVELRSPQAARHRRTKTWLERCNLEHLKLHLTVFS